jgi:hypothetical protein
MTVPWLELVLVVVSAAVGWLAKHFGIWTLPTITRKDDP